MAAVVIDTDALALLAFSELLGDPWRYGLFAVVTIRCDCIGERHNLRATWIGLTTWLMEKGPSRLGADKVRTIKKHIDGLRAAKAFGDFLFLGLGHL